MWVLSNSDRPDHPGQSLIPCKVGCMEVSLHVEYVLSCRGVMTLYVQFQYGTICPSAQPLPSHHAGYGETQSRVGPKKESGLLINSLCMKV